MAGQAATGADAEEAEEPTTARSSTELKWREKHSIDLHYVCSRRKSVFTWFCLEEDILTRVGGGGDGDERVIAQSFAVALFWQLCMCVAVFYILDRVMLLI